MQAIVEGKNSASPHFSRARLALCTVAKKIKTKKIRTEKENLQPSGTTAMLLETVRNKVLNPDKVKSIQVMKEGIINKPLKKRNARLQSAVLMDKDIRGRIPILESPMRKSSQLKMTTTIPMTSQSTLWSAQRAKGNKKQQRILTMSIRVQNILLLVANRRTSSNQVFKRPIPRINFVRILRERVNELKNSSCLTRMTWEDLPKRGSIIQVILVKHNQQTCREAVINNRCRQMRRFISTT